MKKVSVEMGSWIQIIDSDGTIVTGLLQRYDQSRPFDEGNLCFYRNGYRIHIRLDKIIHVFPKVILEENPKDINPSKRNENESK
jgi:hypothetical protein